jgi:ketosteroid isomerase-like protein
LPVAQSALIDLATRYSKAWADRDVDAILAMHADDSTFQVHGIDSGSKGSEAIRRALEAFFNTWEGTRFEGRARNFGENHWVLEYTLHATLSGPLQVGKQLIQGRGQEVSFEGVDIVRVADGQVTSKDTYIDGLAVLAQLV